MRESSVAIARQHFSCNHEKLKWTASAIPLQLLTHPQWGQASGLSVKRLAKYVTTFGALTFLNLILH
jgi:hypothetical protein